MSNIKVLPVFPGLLGQAWPYVGPLLLRGQIECTPDMQVSLNELLEFVLKAHRGECMVWTIIDEDKSKVVAAMITELVDQDGVKRLWVSRMAGENIMTWGKALSDTMASHAKEQGAASVRFWGRSALKRAYRNVKIIQSGENGKHLFERQAV